MFSFVRLIVCCIGFIGASLGSAQAFALHCPFTILVTEAVSPQEGWSALKISSAKTLSGWTIYEGTLGEHQFALAPEEVKQKNRVTQSWNLKHHKGYWIQCRYFETAITMSQVLPKNVKACRSFLELDKQHNVAKSSNVDCN